MVDGYQRHKRIVQYIRQVVAKHPISPPLAIYVSTTDTPCNPQLPYFTFFAKRGVRGIAIPDNSFVGGAQKDWGVVREELTAVARRTPFDEFLFLPGNAAACCAFCSANAFSNCDHSTIR